MRVAGVWMRPTTSPAASPGTGARPGLHAIDVQGLAAERPAQDNELVVVLANSTAVIATATDPCTTRARRPFSSGLTPSKRVPSRARVARRSSRPCTSRPPRASRRRSSLTSATVRPLLWATSRRRHLRNGREEATNSRFSVRSTLRPVGAGNLVEGLRPFPHGAGGTSPPAPGSPVRPEHQAKPPGQARVVSSFGTPSLPCRSVVVGLSSPPPAGIRRISRAGHQPVQGPKATGGLRQVSGTPGHPLPARPREGPGVSRQAEAAREATSTFTPGPMVELTATFFT